MKLRFLLALWAGKLSVIALRILNYRGTVMPGRIALKICPDFLKFAQYPGKVIAVTGTNGKTTVTNMLNDLLTADGKRVLTNQTGANVDDGLSAMMVRGLTITGKCRYDVCIYEVDELWARIVFRWIPPELILITNITRDSIERNAHPGYISDALNTAIPKSVKLVLNADNPFSAFFAPNNQRVYFGVDMLSSDSPTHTNLIQDSKLCPNCGYHLVWDMLYYSDIGRAHCSHCGLQLPKRDYTAININTESGFFDLQDHSGSIRIALSDTALFNIYNAVSVAAVLREIGYDQEKIATLFSDLKIAESRYHCTKLCNTNVFRILSKEWNAYANSRVYEYIRTLPGNKEIIYMSARTGCDKEWSENIAWIYDCDFELLNVPEICNIILYGSRASDYKLRLMLAGVPEERISITDTIDEMPGCLKLFPNDQIFILNATDCYFISHKIEKCVVKLLKKRMRS